MRVCTSIASICSQQPTALKRQNFMGLHDNAPPRTATRFQRPQRCLPSACRTWHTARQAAAPLRSTRLLGAVIHPECSLI